MHHKFKSYSHFAGWNWSIGRASSMKGLQSTGLPRLVYYSLCSYIDCAREAELELLEAELAVTVIVNTRDPLFHLQKRVFSE